MVVIGLSLLGPAAMNVMIVVGGSHVRAISTVTIAKHTSSQRTTKNIERCRHQAA